jgi:CRISPR-associated protein Cas2
MISGIVCYDITLNKYRNRLSKLLSQYGVRIQYSVFEFSLEDKIYQRMAEQIEEFYKDYMMFSYSKGNIDDISRSIRIYLLCEGCLKKVIILDKKPRLNDMGMII